MRFKRATQVKKNVGLCPCLFCREICSEESSSTDCSSCKGWIHWRCVPMTYDLLKEWGQGDLPFTCRMCAFDNGAYSASKVLERTPHSLRTKPVSVSILNRYHQFILESHVPIEVCHDGNCLFRAVSKGLCNTEEHYMQIRLLTLLELILNRSHYDYEHEAFVDHFNDDGLVFDRFDTVLKDTATDFSYCSMIAFSGISAALSVPIQSYCPPTQDAYFRSEPLARVVRGHGVSRAANLEKPKAVISSVKTCNLGLKTVIHIFQHIICASFNAHASNNRLQF
ncbi:hypothetical protein PoB_002788300 [Plakobranchus ocellatus]|uniref:OTU domain-containing protein n=1 Tax=Plakobranchus ocellatus TaxID=259542 RepID=A0AAV4A3Z9_9GAST|nr:hypothetical protein PoB_002788300 [Plakobranchus ocellatus]